MVKNMKPNLSTLINFLSVKSNWCKHSYSSLKGGFCIIGAIGHLFNGKDEFKLKNFLASKLEEFLAFKNLKINTGKYNLTLTTFNDDVQHEMVLEFLKYCENEK